MASRTPGAASAHPKKKPSKQGNSAGPSLHRSSPRSAAGRSRAFAAALTPRVDAAPFVFDAAGALTLLLQFAVGALLARLNLTAQKPLQRA